MDGRLVHILEPLEQQLHQRLTVWGMAAASGLSPSRFTHLFRAATGTGPARYVRHLRLQRAHTLLDLTLDLRRPN